MPCRVLCACRAALLSPDLSLSAQALKLFVTLCKAKPDAGAAVADAALPAALALVTSPLLQVRQPADCAAAAAAAAGACWRSAWCLVQTAGGQLVSSLTI